VPRVSYTEVERELSKAQGNPPLPRDPGERAVRIQELVWDFHNTGMDVDEVCKRINEYLYAEAQALCPLTYWSINSHENCWLDLDQVFPDEWDYRIFTKEDRAIVEAEVWRAETGENNV